MSQEETIFCDIHIPLRDDILSRTLLTFLFDDDTWEDNFLWEELDKRLVDSNQTDSEEYRNMKNVLEKNNGDMYIGGVKSRNEENADYINMILYTRNTRDNDDSHLQYVREAIVNPFNEITGRSKGNDGIFVHMADTTNRCFIVTDGVTKIDIEPEQDDSEDDDD